MTERERTNVIEYLFLIQGDNPQRYEKMTDEELEREYERAWRNHD